MSAGTDEKGHKSRAGGSERAEMESLAALAGHRGPSLSQQILIGTAIFLGILLTRAGGYLLFHSLSEFFTVVIACGIFMVTWNARRFIDNGYLLFIGVAFFFVGIVHLVHLLAYDGMGVFGPGSTANIATQLWIGGRYLQAFAMVVAPLFIGRRFRARHAFGAFAAVTTLLLLSIFRWGVFPDCYGVDGLTRFKVVSEFMIILTFGGAIAVLYKVRGQFDRGVFRLLVASLILAMAADASFTLYDGVYDYFNMLGHGFDIVAFYLIYLALMQTGLVRPYNLLFRNLKLSQEQLAASRDVLEKTVEERTAELVATNATLVQEIAQRRRAQGQLSLSERRFRTLFDRSVEFMGILAPDGTVLEANRTALEFCGIEQGEVVGKPLWETPWFQATPETRLEARKAVEKAARGTFARCEIEHIGKECQRAIVDFSVTPIRDDSGEVVLLIPEGRDITERVMAERELARRQARLRLLASQLTLAEEKERRRVASQLHDYIGQALAVSKMRIGALRATSSEELAESLDSIRDLVDQAIKYTRQLTSELGSPILYEWGLAAALEKLVEDFSEQHGIEATFEESGDVTGLDTDLAVMLFQSVRELLFNVVKHARASRVSVACHADAERVTVAVRDNGAGFDAEGAGRQAVDDPGFGLFSIRERMADLGGEARIESAPGKGAAITLVAPARRQKKDAGR